MDLNSPLQFLFNNAKHPMIMTLGNELRGDDGVGVYIANMLSKELDPNLIINAHNVPVNYLGRIIQKNPDLLIIIDAIMADCETGTIFLFTEDELEENGSTTTHYQEFSKIIKFLERELISKPDIFFIGIQIQNTELMTEMTPEVKKTADLLINELLLLFRECEVAD